MPHVMFKLSTLPLLLVALLPLSAQAADITAEVESIRVIDGGQVKFRLRNDNCNSLSSGSGYVFSLGTTTGAAYYELLLIATRNRSSVTVEVRNCNVGGDKDVLSLKLQN